MGSKLDAIPEDRPLRHGSSRKHTEWLVSVYLPLQTMRDYAASLKQWATQHGGTFEGSGVGVRPDLSYDESLSKSTTRMESDVAYTFRTKAQAERFRDRVKHGITDKRMRVHVIQLDDHD